VDSRDLGSLQVTLRERIARHERAGIGEQDTKAALIVPVLRALGWDVEDLEDVKLEYRRRPSDNPVDYALFILRAPRLFIEAKSLGSHLDDGKWALQILNYATAAGVEWVALTDGNEWRIYNSHATVPVEQKLFRVVRISEPGTRAEETLRLLAKAQMADHLIDDLWKSDFIDRQIRDALNRLFGPDPDPSLVRLVRSKASALSPSEVRKSLGRVRTTFDFPTVMSPPREQIEPAPEATTETVGRTQRAPSDAFGAGTPWRGVTLAQLIEAGIVRVPFEIERRYLGVELRARIVSADRVVVGGTEYDSLSTAGGMARKSVPGSPTRQPHPQTNGWTFWEFRAADGERRQLDTLRRELHERKIVKLEGRRTG
jgi:hypothetical protein